MTNMSSISDFCHVLLFISLSAFLAGQWLKKLIKAMMVLSWLWEDKLLNPEVTKVEWDFKECLKEVHSAACVNQSFL